MGRPIDKAEFEMLATFRYALRQFLRFSETAARQADITPQQHQALLAIAGFPGRDEITMGELAERLQIRHHSAVGLVDRLEAQALVQRQAGVEDRRQVYISLTEHGVEVLDRLSASHRQELRRIGPQLHLLLERLAAEEGLLPLAPAGELSGFQSDEAGEGRELRAEVLAVLSHELGTSLAAIKGYLTALLLDEVAWPEAKRRQFLHRMDEEVDNLQTMVGEILDTARFEAGLLAIETQPVRLPRLVEEIADEMQKRASAHRFVLDFPQEFPLIDADPRRLRQVLRNVLDNAVKYSPDGGLIVIRGQVRPDDVLVSIADQGIGISPEDMVPLFDKYFRAKSPLGQRVPGTGLGLPVSRAIIEAHGGRIWAESRLGEGTTVHFSLPRQGLSAGIEDGAEDG